MHSTDDDVSPCAESGFNNFQAGPLSCCGDDMQSRSTHASCLERSIPDFLVRHHNSRDTVTTVWQSNCLMDDWQTLQHVLSSESALLSLPHLSSQVTTAFTRPYRMHRDKPTDQVTTAHELDRHVAGSTANYL
jgi:hypothetical protein